MNMSQIKEFVTENFKVLVTVVGFLIMLYVQHINNTNHIVELNDRCMRLEAKLDDQYKKIDAIKLDKSVFEANMTQIALMRDDLREMQKDIKELLRK